MIFYIAIIVVVVLVAVGIILDEEDLAVGSFFIGFITLLVVAVFGSIPSGAYDDIRWSKPISNVHAYSNPNQGTVIVYTETSTGRVRALDEGGDTAELVFTNGPSTAAKKCHYSSHTWVPWRISECKYVVTASAVDSTK